MLFLSLVLIQLALFAALVVILRVILTRNIAHATTHLHALNEDYTQKIEEAKKKQLEADKYYDQTLLKAKLDAEKIKVQILKEAHEAQEGVVSDARRQSEEIIAQANKSREALLRELEDRVEARAVLRAAELMAETLGGAVQKELHDTWVEELLQSGLEDLSRLRLPPDAAEAMVTSAYSLSGVQKNTIQKKIKEKAGRELRISDKEDASLLAGLKIKIGSVMIDGSLLFKIREAARHAHANAQ